MGREWSQFQTVYLAEIYKTSLCSTHWWFALLSKKSTHWQTKRYLLVDTYIYVELNISYVKLDQICYSFRLGMKPMPRLWWHVHRNFKVLYVKIQRNQLDEMVQKCCAPPSNLKFNVPLVLYYILHPLKNYSGLLVSI